MGERKDLRNSSVNELVLVVFNNQFLYNQRGRFRFIELLNDLYLYTDEQLEALNKKLEEEDNENSQTQKNG